ncbi:MAG: YdeI/OmpD-associated family protein [Flavobacteriales bacterium]|nr:YdeI/OmpD-associated family protein [Flavobacteriales bacterium]
MSQREWREWLEDNHHTKHSIWLICYKKSSDKPTLAWSDVVDEALCFGWIDSTRRSIDEESFMQYFGRRKPNSMWSKINKEKVEKLIADGRMTKAGLASIEVAKQNGSWNILDQVDELIIPDDLEIAFSKHTGSKDFFQSQSRSVKKMMLSWIVLAKRDETRQKRINEIAECASRETKPKHFN